jgi:hypothetical protein
MKPTARIQHQITCIRHAYRQHGSQNHRRHEVGPLFVISTTLIGLSLSTIVAIILRH